MIEFRCGWRRRTRHENSLELNRHVWPGTEAGSWVMIWCVSALELYFIKNWWISYLSNKMSPMVGKRWDGRHRINDSLMCVCRSSFVRNSHGDRADYSVDTGSLLAGMLDNCLWLPSIFICSLPKLTPEAPATNRVEIMSLARRLQESGKWNMFAITRMRQEKKTEIDWKDARHIFCCMTSGLREFFLSAARLEE